MCCAMIVAKTMPNFLTGDLWFPMERPRISAQNAWLSEETPRSPANWPSDTGRAQPNSEPHHERKRPGTRSDPHGHFHPVLGGCHVDRHRLEGRSEQRSLLAENGKPGRDGAHRGTQPASHRKRRTLRGRAQTVSRRSATSASQRHPVRDRPVRLTTAPKPLALRGRFQLMFLYSPSSS